MNIPERFHALMDFKPVDRLPKLEWAGWWTQTIERWESEGLPKGLDRYELCRWFGLDVYKQAWLRAWHWNIPQPRHHGAGFMPGDDDYADEYSAVEPYLFQIRDKWPVDPDLLSAWDAERNRGEIAIWFTLDGFFWFPRTLFGIEDHLYAFYENPELMHRMNDALADWMIRIIDRMCACCQPDFMTFAEDMSYNHGSMLSERCFDEFMLPYYRRVIPHLKERGIRVFVDSDGNVNDCAPWFAKAGVEGLLPLERQAGVDLDVIRGKCPDMRFIGHFDKMTMPKGEAAMRAEFERLMPVARTGGFAISCDHQTPPGVSLDNYRIYLELFAEYARKGVGA